ncbi:hypothetical protein HHUSO_G16938 [Huso huso]|uniref:Uncharacterized protein n=1 Tax=Huso huso TaxID=61971 RepID=A0ABR0ZBW2_HUSHU
MDLHHEHQGLWGFLSISTVHTPAWLDISTVHTPAWLDISTVHTPAWLDISTVHTPAWLDISTSLEHAHVGVEQYQDPHCLHQ